MSRLRRGDDALATAWRASSNARRVAALAGRTTVRDDVVPTVARVFTLVAQEHTHDDVFDTLVNAALAWRPGDATERLVGLEARSPRRSVRIR